MKNNLLSYIIEHPELENLLNEYCDENSIEIDKISPNNTKIKIKWHCKIHNYTWYGYVNPRIHYPKAPCCAHHVATKEYNFALLYPEYVKDFDYDLNKKKPEQYLPFSHERVYWKCHKCKNKWSTKLYSRTTRLSSCPKCSLAHTSKAEMLILAYIKRTFPKTSKVKIENTEFDIFIPELNVAIEYDGYPWHLTKKGMHIKKLDIANRNNIILINIAECRDRTDIKQSVKEQYTENHRVYYYIIDSCYNLNGLAELIHDIFKANNIELGEFTMQDKKEVVTQTSSKEMTNSLWNSEDIPWIKDWIAPQDIDKAKSMSPSSSSEITIQCPNCKRQWKTRAHWIRKQFRGCSKRSGGCGYKKGLDEQLEITSENFRNGYLQRADKLKQQRDSLKSSN